MSDKLLTKNGDSRDPATACATLQRDFAVPLRPQLPANVDHALRQADISTGTYDGPPSKYRGGGFYLEPAGELGAINRVVVMLRRNDSTVEEDTGVTDKAITEVKVLERYILQGDLVPVAHHGRSRARTWTRVHEGAAARRPPRPFSPVSCCPSGTSSR